MGQSMQRLKGKDDKQKKNDIIIKIQSNLYEKIKAKGDQISHREFYHEISMAVEEMNKSESGFQFNCPTEKEIEEVYEKHHGSGRRDPVTKEEFEKIVTDLVFKRGAKGIREILIYIYGFPISATLIKQAVFPEIVSDDVFIPLITAASVFILGKTKGL